jgi:hypothetical protein
MFANHQTFHPRFGWIKKGYDAAAADPNVFNLKSAPVQLGVGKNMVEAIRFWAMATKVLTRRPHPVRPRVSVYTPTHIGRALLDDRLGVDPYTEDPTTLWILHWLALSERTVLPVWRLAFNDFGALEFTDEELFRYCVDEIAATTWAQPMVSSVQKDVDCLLRMYSRRESAGRQMIDDLIDSPFRELGLIRPSPGNNRNEYRFVRGKKRSLPAAAITYACLDYLACSGEGSRTVSLARLASDPGSPGRIMKVTEQDIADAIEESADGVNNLRMIRPAGSRQLSVETAPTLVALAVLAAHHQHRNPEVHRLAELEVAGHKSADPVLSDREVHRAVEKAEKQRKRDDAA